MAIGPPCLGACTHCDPIIWRGWLRSEYVERKAVVQGWQTAGRQPTEAAPRHATLPPSGDVGRGGGGQRSEPGVSIVESADID
eukprot:SAG25_NODE_252_length_10970_cov_6.386349_3_plen_83_part_00